MAAAELAGRLTELLSLHRHLTDPYIIEFFTEDLWRTLPPSWQQALLHLSYPQVADLLLDASAGDRRYPSVWPLSLLAFRDAAHALAFPRTWRQDSDGGARPEEFLENQNQSSLLGHVFRKHVKPKKQHEIRALGTLVERLCSQTCCRRVVDVGSGQGHLTRFLSFGLGLSVTAIEADPKLVATASKFDRELLWALEKEGQRKGSPSAPPPPTPRHVEGWVDPKASWEAFVQQLEPSDSQEVTLQRAPAGEGGFVLTGLHACGDLSATLLRLYVHCPHVRAITSVACCYMKISTREEPSPPGVLEPFHVEAEALGPGVPRASFGYPMSSQVRALPGHQLSYKAREAACHALEDYIARLRGGSALLRTHCYRAALESFVRDVRPDLRRAAIQTVKKAHLLSFTEYARLGLARVGLPPDLPLDPRRVEAMLGQQAQVVVFFSLALLLAPAVETLVLLDRMMYLQENGLDSRLIPLFNPNFSPRNLVLVSVKSPGQEVPPSLPAREKPS